jgi:ATP synthase protein I
LKKKNAIKTAFAYSTLGIQLALFMLLFVYAGFKLDNHFNTSPLFIVLGTFFGLGAGLYNMISGLKKIEKSGKEVNPEDQDKTKWL